SGSAPMFRLRCLLILLLPLVWSPARAGEPFRFPEGKHGPGQLKYMNGIPVLMVEGTPEQIGEQLAVLSGKPSSRLLAFPQELIAHVATPTGMKLLWPVCVKQGQGLLDNFPPDYRKELEAMIKFSGFDRELMVTANTIFDLKHLLGHLFGCSALVVE